MKISKGQSQPEIVAAAFLILYMVLGRPWKYVSIVTRLFLLVPTRVSTGEDWPRICQRCLGRLCTEEEGSNWARRPAAGHGSNGWQRSLAQSRSPKRLLELQCPFTLFLGEGSPTRIDNLV